MKYLDINVLSDFTKPLLDMPLSYIWNGLGSAIFLEFGKLTAQKHRDGRDASPQGEFGVMIEWDWRIEGRRFIVCGSGSDQSWERGFSLIRGKSVTGVSQFGRLPEILIQFENDVILSSFMIYEGHPGWAIFDRRDESVRTLHARNGRLEFE